MRQDIDKWLQEKIDEDLMVMADEREKLLMESEELQGIDMPLERLEAIHRKLEEKERAVRRKRVRPRVYIALAAVLVLCIGMGVASNGNKVYTPEIFRREQGDELITKANNADALVNQDDEEEVYQEIEEKLGVFPVRFGYRSEGMCLIQYLIEEDSDEEAVLSYQLEENRLYVYINKAYKDSSIINHTDGEKLDTIMVESCGLEVAVIRYQDIKGQLYYEASFEYLNTYYLLTGRMEQEEFIKILENIWIKNV